jgi:glucans biosynthesis protein
VLASAAFAAAALYLPDIASAEDDEVSATLAKITAEGPFSRATVVEIARALAQADFVPPPTDLPDPIKNLTYEQYRDIRSDRNAAIWADEGLPFRMQLFHRGFYYKEEIDVGIVDDGGVHHLAYSPKLFDAGKLVPKPLPSEDIGFAGIRLLGHINSPDGFDEIAVFLGASYFRSLGRGQVYGLSARGLALKDGSAGGRRVPDLPGVLGREADGGQRDRRRERAARQLQRDGRLPVLHTARRIHDRRRRGDALSARGPDQGRARAGLLDVLLRSERPHQLR